MEAKHGSFGFDFDIIYDEIIVEHKISYVHICTIEDGRKATTNFESIVVVKTKIITIFGAELENPPELQKNGWQTILDNFKKHVETI